MLRKFLLTTFVLSFSMYYPVADVWGRGRGGGARGGGFSGGAAARSPGGGSGGGGFTGGAHPSASNFGNSGGMNRSPGVASGARNMGQPNLGQRTATGVAGQAGAGGRVSPSQATAANRFSAPSQNQLSGFLGLPSSGGAGTMSSASQLPARGSNIDVNYGTKQGPGGGQAAGVTVTGPRGNTAGRAAAVGPEGGAAVVGGVQGAAGGTAARGAAVGPGGQVVAGRGAVGPGGYGGGGMVTSGPAGVAAGFTRVTPSGRYTAAAGVRTNYNNWGVYGRGWYVQYPGAWVAAGLTANALWNAATWGSTSEYCGYSEEPPIYYDYGTSVVYEDSNVYINGDNAGTAEEYYGQAAELAKTGADAQAPTEGDWLPLGVFAFTTAENPSSDITVQLAISKDGIIRGNYTDSATKQNQVVKGSVDKQTQRVAFTVGDNKTNIIETGLYNLTKDEAPCLLHFGNERTEQWLLVRLQPPKDSNQ